MPPPSIRKEFGAGEIARTLMAGNLDRPIESASDMTYAVIALLQKYDVTLRAVPREKKDIFSAETD